MQKREKVLNYRRIPSLQAYLIVGQSRRWIELRWHDEEDNWRQGRLDRGSVPIPCPETTFPLDEVYENL